MLSNGFQLLAHDGAITETFTPPTENMSKNSDPIYDHINSAVGQVAAWVNIPPGFPYQSTQESFNA